MIKTMLISLIAISLAVLTITVVRGMHTPDCEAIANQYLSGSTAIERGLAWNQGKEMGCFTD